MSNAEMAKQIDRSRCRDLVRCTSDASSSGRAIVRPITTRCDGPKAWNCAASFIKTPITKPQTPGKFEPSITNASYRLLAVCGFDNSLVLGVWDLEV